MDWHKIPVRCEGELVCAQQETLGFSSLLAFWPCSRLCLFSLLPGKQPGWSALLHSELLFWGGELNLVAFVFDCIMGMVPVKLSSS